MKMCPICQDKVADKKNVHLIPWFLIKKCITYKGSGNRDMEVSFTINPRDFSKVYSGRSVLPESLEDLGELHDLQKEKENPYSVDNLICSDCETKLSRLEAIFASEFSSRKLEEIFLAGKNKLNAQVISKKNDYNYSLYALFVQSIFYRCSIGKFNGFSLKKAVENQIEINLREVFKAVDFKKLKASDEVKIQKSFPVIVCTSLENAHDPTESFILVGKSNIPYFIMAADWMFQLFEKEGHLNSTVEWLYGLSAKINVKEAFEKTDKVSHTVILGPDLSRQISKNILQFLTEKKIIGLKRNIRDLHLHMFGVRPDDYIADFIYKQYFIHFKKTKSEFESLVNAFLELKRFAK